MRFRNVKTGAIIDVPSEIKGPWERIDGGVKPAVVIPEDKPEEIAEKIKKPARKTKK